MNYTRVDLIKSYLDAQRYSNADKVLADDTQAFTVALQRGFNIYLTDLKDIDATNPQWPLAFVFHQGIKVIQTQDDGVLEAGLLYLKLEQGGEAGKQILNQYVLVGEARQQVMTHAMKLLTDVVDAVWPDSPLSVTSDNLLQNGFDDSNRPDPMDFW
ncbi:MULTISPECIES: hypothetical protein [Deinococcus]|uniref:Uncharacterized protein n=1 Tax=Deinococcus rufus TaxID=2136097 RepID=A0ABV7Z3Z1_9DEIO|nr:hypothetical protein [Deinococcus sp. AB2017081]WQE95982.1 hypothetical protein U2P90_03575 [Deinococcus sp. AB2017081]